MHFVLGLLHSKAKAMSTPTAAELAQAFVGKPMVS